MHQNRLIGFISFNSGGITCNVTTKYCVVREDYLKMLGRWLAVNKLSISQILFLILWQRCDGISVVGVGEICVELQVRLATHDCLGFGCPVTCWRKYCNLFIYKCTYSIYMLAYAYLYSPVYLSQWAISHSEDQNFHRLNSRWTLVFLQAMLIVKVTHTTCILIFFISVRPPIRLKRLLVLTFL